MGRSVLITVMLLAAPLLARAEQPLRVTTDNHAHCALLLDRLAVAPGAHEGPPARLLAEGARLCHAGHPRPGVARLRRALRMVASATP